jgi:hypothetical protein
MPHIGKASIKIPFPFGNQTRFSDLVIIIKIINAIIFLNKLLSKLNTSIKSKTNQKSQKQVTPRFRHAILVFNTSSSTSSLNPEHKDQIMLRDKIKEIKNFLCLNKAPYSKPL